MRCCKTSYGFSILPHLLPRTWAFVLLHAYSKARSTWYRQIGCKISGRKHVLPGGWEIWCTNLTEWLPQVTQDVVPGECSDHGCHVPVVCNRWYQTRVPLTMFTMTMIIIIVISFEKGKKQNYRLLAKKFNKKSLIFVFVCLFLVCSLFVLRCCVGFDLSFHFCRFVFGVCFFFVFCFVLVLFVCLFVLWFVFRSFRILCVFCACVDCGLFVLFLGHDTNYMI